MAVTLKPGVKFHPALAVEGQRARFTLSYSTLKIDCLRGHKKTNSFGVKFHLHVTKTYWYTFGVILVFKVL